MQHQRKENIKTKCEQSERSVDSCLSGKLDMQSGSEADANCGGEKEQSNSGGQLRVPQRHGTYRNGQEGPLQYRQDTGGNVHVTSRRHRFQKTENLRIQDADTMWRRKSAGRIVLGL